MTENKAPKIPPFDPSIPLILKIKFGNKFKEEGPSYPMASLHHVNFDKKTR